MVFMLCTEFIEPMNTIAPVTITIRNQLRLSGLTPELYARLTETMQFLNPKWIENERMGRWNRKTPKVLKFYRRHGNGRLFIPRGYLRQLIQLCRRSQQPYVLDDQRRTLNAVPMQFEGTLRPFQQDAVDVMLSRDFGTLSAPTGSGKTVMALAMVAARKQPTVVVVHTRELATQWLERARQFIGLDGKQIGQIGGGRKRPGTVFTVALVQTLVRRTAQITPKTGFLIVDECHRCPSRTFTRAVKAFDCRYLLGLSATPYRRDNLSRLIFWYMGDMHHQVDKKNLVARGAVLPVDVFFRETGFDSMFDPVTDYSRMLSQLADDDERNRLIVDDVAAECNRHPGTCLVLTDRKRHCDALQALLRYRHGITAAVLTGDLRTGQRKEVLASVTAGKVPVLIATGQLVGEGFDCALLSTLFLASPIRFSGRLLQYLGRVLRPAPGKNKARVFDYVDVKVDTLKSAARARKRVYAR